MGGQCKSGKRILQPIFIRSHDPDIPGQVYFHQEIPYWIGRFSTICDRLKTVDGLLASSNDGSTLSSPSHLERADTGRSFQLAEDRQTECALKELRSYCQTNVALRSFEEFEAQIRCHPQRRGEAHRKFAQRSVIRSTEEAIRSFKPKLGSKPKVGWHFGQSQVFNIANRALATVSAIVSKGQPLTIKSKTTSNFADILDGRATMMGPETNSCRTGNVKSPLGRAWRRLTTQEAQAQAKRVREQRVLAKAERYRRTSGQESGVGKAWTNGPDPPRYQRRRVSRNWCCARLEGSELPPVDGKPATKGHF
jgi:hypothetical protein